MSSRLRRSQRRHRPQGPPAPQGAADALWRDESPTWDAIHSMCPGVQEDEVRFTSKMFTMNWRQFNAAMVDDIGHYMMPFDKDGHCIGVGEQETARICTGQHYASFDLADSTPY